MCESRSYFSSYWTWSSLHTSLYSLHCAGQWPFDIEFEFDFRTQYSSPSRKWRLRRCFGIASHEIFLGFFTIFVWKCDYDKLKPGVKCRLRVLHYVPDRDVSFWRRKLDFLGGLFPVVYLHPRWAPFFINIALLLSIGVFNNFTGVRLI